MVLYTIDCPQCKVLEKKLAMKKVPFEISRDMEKMEELGIKFAPALQLDNGDIMNFTQANKWLNEGGYNG